MVTISALQKKEVFLKAFFSKYDQIRRKLQIWSHLQKKSLMENFDINIQNLNWRGPCTKNMLR